VSGSGLGCHSTVESEDELVEVCLEVRTTNPVMCAIDPGLEVRDRTMGERHDLSRVLDLALENANVLVAEHASRLLVGSETV
jgi:hypothetical protein